MTQTSTTITVDSLPIANSIDPVQDRILIYTASATDIQGISRNTYLGLSSQPVGISDSQTLTAKVLDNSNTITVKDTNLTIQDDGDATKQAKFQASGITTGTTRTYTLPDTSDTLTTNAATQTLTNKTLTSPVISGGTIDSSAITVDTIAGHTTSNTGTVYGIPVTTGTLGTTALAANAVQANQLATNAITLGYIQLTSNFSTTSISAVQLTGLSLSVTIPSGGRRIKLTAYIGNPYNGTSGDGYELTLWDGTVGTGTQLALATNENGIGDAHFIMCMAVIQPAAGAKTYNVGIRCVLGGIVNTQSSTGSPSFLLVETI